MGPVQKELRRLSRACARRAGRGRAARAHLLLLLVAVVAAFVSRARFPLPGLEQIEGRVLPVVLTALALYAVGAVFALLWTRVLRQREADLARELDRRYAWHDETTTALGLTPERRAQPLPALLSVQTEGRLRQIDAARLVPARSSWIWPRRLLAFLFAFILLAPGVQGLLGDRGASAHGEDPLGADGADAADDTVAVPRPMRMDFWLQSFVEDPLPVEPLPPETDAKEPGAKAAGDAAPGEPK